MSYGIKVYDSLGATMFDSEHLVEMTAHYFTCKGNVAFPAIPDWVGGSDSRTQIGSSYTRQQQNVSYSAYSWPSGQGGTSNFYGVGSNYLAFDYDATPFPAVGQVMTIGSNEYKVIGSPTLANHTISGYDSNGFPIVNYSNATHYIPFDQDMTSFRNSTANRTFRTYEYPNYFQTLWVRPLSSSYSGYFGWAHVGGNLTNPLSIYDSTGSTTNTFEVYVTVTAAGWGAIADTRPKFLAGSTTNGIICQTDQTGRHTPSGPLVQMTTMDSRTRFAQVKLAKSWAGGTDYSNTTFSLGSLSSSSTKRWVRIDSTRFIKIGGGYPIPRYSAKYQWNSNNSISVVWNSNGGGQFSLQDSYVTELPFIVAEFGVGA